MPIKTGLGTAGQCLHCRGRQVQYVSMPFKTGLGTAEAAFERFSNKDLMFQCPLRRAWVLRSKAEKEGPARREENVSMPFKTGLGTAERHPCDSSF